MKLGPTQTRLLQTLAVFAKNTGKMMPISMLREALDISPNNMRNVNASLVEKGVLLKESYGKYSLNKDMPEYAKKVFNDAFFSL